MAPKLFKSNLFRIIPITNKYGKKARNYSAKGGSVSGRQKSKKPVIARQIHKLDATGQSVGRLATQIAIILRGKNKPTFQPHIDSGDNVIISNASKVKLTGKKIEQKEYYHFSGYPGGLKTKKMKDVFSKNPGEVIKRAVWNMLPKNKLRAKMIKRLKFTK